MKYRIFIQKIFIFKNFYIEFIKFNNEIFKMNKNLIDDFKEKINDKFHDKLKNFHLIARDSLQEIKDFFIHYNNNKRI